MGISDRDYMHERTRGRGASASVPTRRGDKARMELPTGAVIEPGPPVMTRSRWIILLAVIIAALACFAIFRGDTHYSGGDFPPNGTFKVKPAQAHGATGMLAITAGETNAIVELFDPARNPVFIGFVRARDTAQLPIPIGSWRMIVTETSTWDGSFHEDDQTVDGPEVRPITVLPGSTTTVVLHAARTPSFFPKPSDIKMNLGD
ncbi:hypothetical protein GCM10010990_34910 [Croceicoccus mobilis]|uniref:Uncharacterized protein n=2 Tax=Croceicoccus mobilis TaxID=1703339 RepID=A0A916Z983_9SPHN|nr:hypothetical protein GCM10010990_34910 [Croceicoccus mobilis]